MWIGLRQRHLQMKKKVLSWAAYGASTFHHVAPDDEGGGKGRHLEG